MYYAILLVNVVLLVLLRRRARSVTKLDVKEKKVVRAAYMWLWSPIVLVIVAVVLLGVSNFVFEGSGTTSQTTIDSSSSLVAGELETTSTTDSIRSILNILILVLGMLSLTVVPIMSWFKYRKASILLKSKAPDGPETLVEG